MIPLLTTLLLLATQVVDGDTYVFPDLGKVRLEAADTPEIVGRCDYETMLADAARGYAVRFLSEPVLVSHDGKRDRYGRLLVTIKRGDRDLSAELIERGLARRWGGARRSWCEGVGK